MFSLLNTCLLYRTLSYSVDQVTRGETKSIKTLFNNGFWIEGLGHESKVFMSTIGASTPPVNMMQAIIMIHPRTTHPLTKHSLQMSYYIILIHPVTTHSRVSPSPYNLPSQRNPSTRCINRCQCSLWVCYGRVLHCWKQC